MLDPRELTQIQHGVPVVAVTDKSTRANRTGSWKYIRPIYQDKIAPCNQGCPVGIDIEACMNLVREGRTDEAVDLLLVENPFPATTGRVCYHPCETVCNRARFDEAVSIHAVERGLGDLALERPLPEPAPRTRRETVGVIGSGPAGLSCAYHLARLGYGVTVYEAGAEPGGVLRSGIPEYRLPRRVLDREIERIRALGVEIRCGVAIGRQPSIDELMKQHDVVVAATGAHRERPLEVEGGNLAGVRPGLEFLAEVNRGLRPRLGRRVVVIGGGATAIDCACSAVRLGAEVRLVHAGSREQLTGAVDEVREAACEGVRFEFHAVPVAVLGAVPAAEVGALSGVEASFGEFEDARGVSRVGGVRCVRVAPGDGDGPPRPVAGSDFFLEADTVLVALGEDVDGGYLPRTVAAADGVVHTDALGATGEGRLFACGDLIDQPRTIALAIGSGKRAAIGIDRHLRGQSGEAGLPEAAALRLGPEGNVSMARWRGADPVRRENPVNEVVGYDQINTAHFAHVPRFRDRYRTAEWTRTRFEEANLGLTREDAVAEACRCFNCGVCNSCEVCLVFCPDAAITRRHDGGFNISYKYCKGCGVCAAECPRCAMSMTREGL
jgi:NADPH-dependent glutamate synthase beta subunit-like oxidoreductase